MDFVCFGQQNWDVCWTGKQQLMSRLALRGHRVLYIDPVWDESAGALRASLDWIRGGPAGELAHVGPEALWTARYRYVPPLRWRLNVARAASMPRRLADALGFSNPVALALRPQALPAVLKLQPAVIAYYAVDELTAFGHVDEARAREVRAQEEAFLGASDFALAVSPRLHERFRHIQPRTFLLENGADLDHFSPASLEAAPVHPALEGRVGPTLGFVGQVDDRLDQDLLLRLARSLPDCRIVLAGRVKDGVDVAKLRSEERIHLLGYVPYEALPSVLKTFDVCLVPYRLTDLTHSCNPLKVFEYLATGLPVVSTPLDGLRACRDVVALAASADAFVDEVRRALRDPRAGRSERLRVAARNSWEGRVDELERLFRTALNGAERVVRATPRARRSEAGWTPPAAEHGSDSLTPVGRAAYRLSRIAGAVARAGAREKRAADGGPRRILFARRMLLGDAVVAIPALQRLRSHFPRARITIGVQPGAGAASLLLEAGLADEVLELDHLSPSSRGRQLRQASAFLARGFDAVLSGTRWFVLREAFYSGAPRILTFDDGHPLQRLGTHVLPFDPALHESDNNVALVDALAASPPPAVAVPPRLPDPDPEARAAAARLVERLAPGRAPLLVFHPGAQKASRRWPASRFAALAETLLRKHARAGVVLTGVRAEAGLIDDILARVPEPLRARAASAAGATTLPVLFALLRAANVVVCNDAGVMHAARASGADLIALLGPEDHRRWGPHPSGRGRCIALRTVVPCAPCTLLDCEPHFCMRSLGVEAVADAVEELLAGGPGERWRSRTAGSAGGPQAAEGPARAAYDLRLNTRDWRDLEDAGFLPPAVTVLCAPGAEPPADLDLHYPVDRVAVLPQAPEDGSPAEDAWWRGIRSAAGDLVALRERGDGWTGAGLARAVADAVRRPDRDAWIAGAPDRPTLVRAGSPGTGEDAASLVRSWLDRDGASRATAAHT